jgi:hypothetical protein
MIPGVTHFSGAQQGTAFFPVSKPYKVVLVIAGLACLMALPFLRSWFSAGWKWVCSAKPTPDPTHNKVEKAVAGSTGLLQGESATGVKIPFTPYSLSVKVMQNCSVYQIYAERESETLVDLMSKAFQLVVQGDPQYTHWSYFDDVRIFIQGQLFNTPATEYIPVAELPHKWKFHHQNSIPLILDQKTEEEVQRIVTALREHQGRIKEVFPGMEWSCSGREVLQQFRAALHSYCNRIYRGKVDQANAQGLLTLHEVFAGIIEKSSTPEVKKYFNGLLTSVSNVYARYLTSYKALQDELMARMARLPAPTPSSVNQFKVSLVGKEYQFSSLEDVARHANYFDMWREGINMGLEENNGQIQVPDNLTKYSVQLALRYLQGENIQNELPSFPFTLHAAAEFLGIPRLALVCEVYLISALEANKIEKNTVKMHNVDRIKSEMPHFYKALDIKGWLAQPSTIPEVIPDHLRPDAWKPYKLTIELKFVKQGVLFLDLQDPNETMTQIKQRIITQAKSQGSQIANPSPSNVHLYWIGQELTGIDKFNADQFRRLCISKDCDYRLQCVID